MSAILAAALMIGYIIGRTFDGIVDTLAAVTAVAAIITVVAYAATGLLPWQPGFWAALNG